MRRFVGRPILVWEGNDENSTYIQFLMFPFKIYFMFVFCNGHAAFAPLDIFIV